VTTAEAKSVNNSCSASREKRGMQTETKGAHLKVQQCVIRWHRSSAEEVLAHPVGWSVRFKMINILSMTEVVYKKLAVSFQAAGDLLHQLLIVFHMLEHLD